jgi:hypothetical protein
MAIWFEVISVLGKQSQKFGGTSGPWYASYTNHDGIGAVLEEDADDLVFGI